MHAWSIRRGVALTAVGLAVQTACWALPASTFAQDTHVRIDSSPGGWPANVHLNVAPLASAFTIQKKSRGVWIYFVDSGTPWEFEFGAPFTLPFGAGVYDSAGADYTALYMPKLQIKYDDSYTTTPYGSFEVRQARRDAQGNFTSLWVSFRHVAGTPDRPPLIGEIRWNADT